MNRKRLAKIERELSELQKNPHGKSPRLFVRLAKKLGRKKVNRGKEPTYASPSEPDLGSPLSIPNHDVLKSGTAASILNTLQNDHDLWAQHLDQIGEPDSGDDAEDSDDEDSDDASENAA
jgi:hypothetical protein